MDRIGNAVCALCIWNEAGCCVAAEAPDIQRRRSEFDQDPKRQVHPSRALWQGSKIHGSVNGRQSAAEQSETNLCFPGGHCHCLPSVGFAVCNVCSKSRSPNRLEKEAAFSVKQQPDLFLQTGVCRRKTLHLDRFIAKEKNVTNIGQWPFRMCLGNWSCCFDYAGFEMPFGQMRSRIRWPTYLTDWRWPKFVPPRSQVQTATAEQNCWSQRCWRVVCFQTWRFKRVLQNWADLPFSIVDHGYGALQFCPCCEWLLEWLSRMQPRVLGESLFLSRKAFVFGWAPSTDNILQTRNSEWQRGRLWNFAVFWKFDCKVCRTFLAWSPWRRARFRWRKPATYSLDYLQGSLNLRINQRTPGNVFVPNCTLYIFFLEELCCVLTRGISWWIRTITSLIAVINITRPDNGSYQLSDYLSYVSRMQPGLQRIACTCMM